MTTDEQYFFAYERMVEDALRGVLRQALDIVAVEGLPGEHHFYITFDTRYPGVELADSLRAAHPEEMTIVLQNQFWDLHTDEEGFEVTLSFSGVSNHLRIPFAAVNAFADPHAKFGLQFHVDAMREDAEEVDEDDLTADMDLANAEDETADTTEAPEGDATEDGDDNVVTLDAFRKK